MKSEAELHELHTRLVKAIRFAVDNGMPGRQLADLVKVKVQIEWALGMNTRAAEVWQVAVFNALVNLEGLQATYARSREAAAN
jgi:hypothetical protein